jgi:2-polyprenyl-3-methyl-5-hydroxy-6-metoxy-1,4-benzoquinol methylase
VQGRWNFKQCPNPDCGLVWLDPMPLVEDIPKAYENYHTHAAVARPRSAQRRAHEAIRDGYLQVRHRYSTGQGWYRVLFPMAFLHPGGPAELAASTGFLQGPGQGRRMLDVGCGRGDMLIRMEALGWDAEGVDLDSRAVEVAKSRGLRVRVGELEQQNYPSNRFDAIYMNHVAEHVPDPIGLLRECDRVLAPGGRLVVITPNIGSWSHQHFGPDWRGLEPPRHLYLFSRTSLAAAAARAGIENLRIRTLASGTRYFSSTSETLRKKREAAGSSAAPEARSQGIKPIVHQLWARILLVFRPDAGDELLMLVGKDSAAQR